MASSNSTYAVLFRTHIWDVGIEKMARQIVAACPEGDFYIAADETRGHLEIGDFKKLAHSDDFSEYELPNTPSDQVLWWNADYVLYFAKRQIPHYDYYILIEYDVFLNINLDEVVRHCNDRGIDFVAHSLMPSSSQWYRDTIIEVTPNPFWAQIPFIILSSRAIDLLFEQRRQLAHRFFDGILKQWPYCEVYIPTIIKLDPGMRTAEVREFGDVNLLSWRPFKSVRDPLLTKENVIAHPVLVGERFIRAHFWDCRVDRGGQILNQSAIAALPYEELTDIQAVFGDYETVIERENLYSNFAMDKPATQSSRWHWAHGSSLGEDARRVLSNYLPPRGFTTDREINAWWEVDLENIKEVHFVEIINSERDSNRFTKFQIFSSLNGMDWQLIFEKSDSDVVSSDPCKPMCIELPSASSLRFLRIVQLGNDHFHLRRVRILGK